MKSLGGDKSFSGDKSFGGEKSFSGENFFMYLFRVLEHSKHFIIFFYLHQKSQGLRIFFKKVIILKKI
jgi:hypothetical protein